MILTRPGNKRRIAHKIHPYFPPDYQIYIELFFGAGGMYFSLPKRPKHAFLNDLDNDVFNLWMQVQENKDRLIEELTRMPVHASLWDYWRKTCPIDPVMRAVRFLLLSNFGYMGKPLALKIESRHTKKSILDKINNIELQYSGARFTSCDFRDVFAYFRKDDMDENAFIYSDSPYLDTSSDSYGVPQWTETDTTDLFKVLTESGCKFALSEFDHPKILELAESHGLNVVEIGIRQNMKNRRMEILVMNYDPWWIKQQTLF